MIEITLLGTGSPIPDPNRAGPSTLVRASGRSLLVDAGRGVVMRMAAAAAGANQLDAVLLTHLHSDHVCDLNDIITTGWVMSMEPTPLRIFGPPGTQKFVDSVVGSLSTDIGYRMAHHEDLNWEPQIEVTEVADGDEFSIHGLAVQVGATDHRPVEPTIGFRISDGANSVVMAGDTIPCDTLDRLCSGADALVHTALRADLLENIPIQRLQDICGYHSSVEQCAQTAARAGMNTLVLTHYVPALTAESEPQWRELAVKHFDGRVELGDDLLRVEIGD